MQDGLNGGSADSGLGRRLNEMARHDAIDDVVAAVATAMASFILLRWIWPAAALG